MRILVDTNVIIDALTSRKPWNESAEQIFLMAANRRVDMFITASSATDIYYLIRKYLHSSETAKQVMGKLYSLTGILEVTGNDCLEALASPIPDYEDAVVEQVASRKGMDYIVTRNIKDYQEENTKFILPDDFVKQMEDDSNDGMES
ncbi:MAG: PIN domain-containing protein [Roseburia sp.]